MGILNDLLGEGFTEDDAPDYYFMKAQRIADSQRVKFETDREKAYRDFIEKQKTQEQLDRIEEKLDKLLATA